MSSVSVKPDAESYRRSFIQLKMKTVNLSYDLIIALLKSFFVAKGFCEVKTPSVIRFPFPEPHINAVSADNGFYRTSPELHMKILLSEGHKKIFEIGPCRRKDEIGRLHREEFTMLEWYETGADYNDLIEFTKEMLLYVNREAVGSSKIVFNGHIIDIELPWEIISIREAFANFANMTPEDALRDGKFEEVLTAQIEPQLPENRPVILKDYPAELAALAKLNEYDKSLAERWELYIGGIEISNTYTELTDPGEHDRRFAKFANQRKEAGSPEYPVDPLFLKALKKGIPKSAGCALGVDRLIMILTNADSI